MSLALRLAATLLALSAGLAAAQPTVLDLPALYQVTGVAADDVLNLRAEPRADAEILTTLSPDATDIEVAELSADGRWALVNTPDRWSGWVAARYLRRLPGPPSHELPLPIACGGAEPFWGLTIRADGQARYSDPMNDTGTEQDVAMTLDWSGPAAARAGLELGAHLAAADGDLTAVLLREACSDGMSDIAFGLSIRAIRDVGGERFMLEGCCSISPSLTR